MNSFNKKKTITKICGALFTFAIPAMFLSSCTGITLSRQNFLDTGGQNNRRSNDSNSSNNQDLNRRNLSGTLSPSVLGQPDNQNDPTQEEDQNPLSPSKPDINSSAQNRPTQPNKGGSDNQNETTSSTSSSFNPFDSQPNREQTPAPFYTVRMSSHELTNTGLLGADKSEVVINLSDNKITLGSTIQNYFSTSLETSKLLEIFSKNVPTYSPNFIFTDKKPSDWKEYTSTNSFYVSNGTRAGKGVTILNFILNSIEYIKINNLITVNDLKPNVVTRTDATNPDLVLLSSHVSDNSLINNSFLQFNVVQNNNQPPYTIDKMNRSVTFDNLTLEKRVYLDKNRSPETVRNWIVSLGQFTIFNAF